VRCTVHWLFRDPPHFPSSSRCWQMAQVRKARVMKCCKYFVCAHIRGLGSATCFLPVLAWSEARGPALIHRPDACRVAGALPLWIRSGPARKSFKDCGLVSEMSSPGNLSVIFLQQGRASSTWFLMAPISMSRQPETCTSFRFGHWRNKRSAEFLEVVRTEAYSYLALA
jgi:hypothetical protein